jgi:hypothetical protein
LRDIEYTYQEFVHLFLIIDNWPRECQLLEIGSMVEESAKLGCLIGVFIGQPSYIVILEAEIFDRLSVFLQTIHIDLSVIRLIHIAKKREPFWCSQRSKEGGYGRAIARPITAPVDAKG